MKVLVVKTSSMGDLIHTLPALTDAQKAIPDIQFDWVAEQGFAKIPGWHPAVNKTITIAIRRWRNNLRQSWQQGEIQSTFEQLRTNQYDVVIDAQGLFKSAVVTRCARGPSFGMNSKSCREPLASWFYQHKINISKQAHAITRVRQLFAESLAYSVDLNQLDYGLTSKDLTTKSIKAGTMATIPSKQPYLVFLHGTSRAAKYWPQDQWIALAKLAAQAGYQVYLPWGSAYEQDYAQTIADQTDNVKVLAKMSLTEIVPVFSQAQGVVGVDTGLAHLTAALNVPAITLYIETYPCYTGACGSKQTCLSEKQGSDHCSETGLKTIFHQQLTADVVWKALFEKL